MRVHGSAGRTTTAAGREWTPYDRSVDVLIGKLRQKIEPDPKSPSLIKTERGVGYIFSAPVELF